MDPLTLEELRRRCTHPLSGNLQPNPHQSLADVSAYVSVLDEYGYPEGTRTDYDDTHGQTVGWKFHLNAPPASVREVSGYLRRSRYNHKFLKGGEVEHGKIFTVYIGSRGLAEQEGARISTDLRAWLARPVDELEAEFAPGVVARFRDNHCRTDGPRFAQYGSAGISYLEGMHPSCIAGGYERNKPIVEQLSFDALVSLHGSYFTG
jgi:hypothetical protein